MPNVNMTESHFEHLCEMNDITSPIRYDNGIIYRLIDNEIVGLYVVVNGIDYPIVNWVNKNYSFTAPLFTDDDEDHSIENANFYISVTKKGKFYIDITHIRSDDTYDDFVRFLNIDAKKFQLDLELIDNNKHRIIINMEKDSEISAALMVVKKITRNFTKGDGDDIVDGIDIILRHLNTNKGVLFPLLSDPQTTISLTDTPLTKVDNSNTVFNLDIINNKNVICKAKFYMIHGILHRQVSNIDDVSSNLVLVQMEEEELNWLLIKLAKIIKDLNRINVSVSAVTAEFLYDFRDYMNSNGRKEESKLTDPSLIEQVIKYFDHIHVVDSALIRGLESKTSKLIFKDMIQDNIYKIKFSLSELPDPNNYGVKLATSTFTIVDNKLIYINDNYCIASDVSYNHVTANGDVSEWLKFLMSKFDKDSSDVILYLKNLKAAELISSIVKTDTNAELKDETNAVELFRTHTNLNSKPHKNGALLRVFSDVDENTDEIYVFKTEFHGDYVGVIRNRISKEIKISFEYIYPQSSNIIPDIRTLVDQVSYWMGRYKEMCLVTEYTPNVANSFYHLMTNDKSKYSNFENRLRLIIANKS